jgi:transposase InsO family protein
VEVILTKTTSNWCIQQLRTIFATFGYPFALVSDNGPNFTSSIFNQYLKAYGVTHKFSAHYHRATNGQAERFIQTVKKQFTVMENDGGNFSLKKIIF